MNAAAGNAASMVECNEFPERARRTVKARYEARGVDHFIPYVVTRELANLVSGSKVYVM
jgi:hypothetical protein